MGCENLCYFRNFSEHEPVDLGLAESLFEGAWGAMRFQIGAHDELRRLSGEAFDFPKVIDLIGHDAEQAVPSKRAMNGDEEILGDDATAPMPAFGPGIGKQQMKQGDRIRRQHLLNCIGGFHPQDTRIGEFALDNFPMRAAHSPEETFNSKKVPCRIGRGDFYEEGAVAAPKIDLERRVSVINGLQIELRKIIRRNDFYLRRQSRKFSELKHLN